MLIEKVDGGLDMTREDVLLDHCPAHYKVSDSFASKGRSGEEKVEGKRTTSQFNLLQFFFT